MSKKQTKKTVKGGGAAITVTLVICGVLLVALLFVFFFADIVKGRRQLSRALDALEKADTVVITDPLYDGGALPWAAEAVLTGDGATELARELIDATESLSYSGVVDGSKGYWDIRLAYEYDGKAYSLYLKEGGIYSVDKRGYLFEIKSADKEAYLQVYRKTEKLLEAAADT